jgi:hypothetical protein
LPLSDEQLRRYRRQVDARRRRTAAALAALWDRLDRYDDETRDLYVTRAAPILAGAKASTVALSAAMFAWAVDLRRPPPVRPRDVLVPTRTDHPFLAFWHALKEERPRPEAVAAGRSQAEAVGADFVQQTARRTGDAAARAANVRVRYERRPESSACEWCQDVARETYRTAESADFGHDRCFCDVVPKKNR